MGSKGFYYPYFDYLRIFLASAVMFYHDRIVLWEFTGTLAVDVFFALSGWLIGGILLRMSTEDLSRFYFNRAVRIWIPYYIALIFIVIASLLKDPLNGKWLEFVFYKLTFVYNLFGPPQLAEFRDYMPLDGTGNHFWSVNAEEQFYLLAPLILVLIPKLGKSNLTWFCLAASAWYFDIYAPISFGVFAAVLTYKYGEFYSSSIAKMMLLTLAMGSSFGLVFDDNYNLYSPVLAICVVMLLAIKGKRNRIGEFLGGMSYPLYLNHWIGVFFFNALLDPFGLRDSGIRQFLAVLMNFGIAAILYWYVDHRILSMRSRYFSRNRGVVTIYCAYAMVIFGIIVGLLLTLKL